jgi:hypothetical protein
MMSNKENDRKRKRKHQNVIARSVDIEQEVNLEKKVLPKFNNDDIEDVDFRQCRIYKSRLRVRLRNTYQDLRHDCIGWRDVAREGHRQGQCKGNGSLKWESAVVIYPEVRPLVGNILCVLPHPQNDKPPIWLLRQCRSCFEYENILRRNVERRQAISTQQP